jgi:hypothetical protein
MLRIASFPMRICAGPEILADINAEANILMQLWFEHITLEDHINDQEPDAMATGSEQDTFEIPTEIGSFSKENQSKNCFSGGEQPEESVQAPCKDDDHGNTSEDITELAERLISRFANRMLSSPESQQVLL